METFRYEIVGAGSSEENKINVSLSCETATTICCVCRTIYENPNACPCSNNYRDEVNCFTVTTANTEVFWHPTDVDSVRVWYQVTNDCEEVIPPSCTAQCSDLTAYTVPAFVDEKYDGDIDIYYNCTLTCENEDANYIGGREIVRGVEKVNILDAHFWHFDPDKKEYSGELSVSGCSSTTVKVAVKESEECESSKTAYIYISFTPKVAQPTGSSVNVEFSYKKIEVINDNEGCKKRTTTGFFAIPWKIEECRLVEGDSDAYCCEDHEISGLTDAGIIRLSGKIDSETEIYYKGEKVPDSGVSYSITQLGYNSIAGCSINGNSNISFKGGNFPYYINFNNICSPSCISDESFGVKSDSVEVLYETDLYSDVWKKEGKVPSTGGRIKIRWDYVSHTILSNCEENFKEGTYEQILTVGSCEEPQIDKVIYFKKQFKEFYKSEYLCSSETSKLAVWKCESCEALSSTVSEDCNQTPPLKCPYCGADSSHLQLVQFDMSNAQPALDEGDDTVFNKITFDFNQDCQDNV